MKCTTVAVKRSSSSGGTSALSAAISSYRVVWMALGWGDLRAGHEKVRPVDSVMSVFPMAYLVYSGPLPSREAPVYVGEDLRQNLCQARRARESWTSGSVRGTSVARCNRAVLRLSHAPCNIFG